MDNPQTITIATVNVNGIGLKDRRDKTLKTLREYNADVIFLQETHTARITEWQGLSYCSFGTKNSSGSAILFHRELGFSVEEQSSDCDGRVASVRGIINGHKVNFVSVYAPNNPVTKKIFFSEELPKFLSVDYRKFVGGDFNCVDSLVRTRYFESFKH